MKIMTLRTLLSAWAWAMRSNCGNAVEPFVRSGRCTDFAKIEDFAVFFFFRHFKNTYCLRGGDEGRCEDHNDDEDENYINQ
jgi:hypothetical protein